VALRFCELRKESVDFLNKQEHVVLAEKFSQEKFIANVAYLGDIFCSLRQFERVFFPLKHVYQQTFIINFLLII